MSKKMTLDKRLVDVFTYIYAHYEVIGCVEVTHINAIKGERK